MRIQHNIMAMNAYRNYNNNTSALSKNLEKLSSGYKINRAGDDAAGLAISEKMRAQITGLNAAQKNVKDGISMVKTAEGAMQEIQDMLNRMDYLSTQSANGTYDNEVDRKNLQKEVDALKSEINRIADSSNFNGIKLLDGSMDAANGITTQTSTTNVAADLSAKISTIGTQSKAVDGKLTPGDEGAKYQTSLYFGEIKNSNAAAKNIVVNYKDASGAAKTVTLNIAAGKTVTTQEIADALKSGTTNANITGVTDSSTTGVSKDTANGDVAKDGKFSELYDVRADGNILVITAKKKPTEGFDGDKGTLVANKLGITSITNTFDTADVTNATKKLTEDFAGAGTDTAIAFGAAAKEPTNEAAPSDPIYRVASEELDLSSVTDLKTLHNVGLKIGTKTYVFQVDGEELKGTTGATVIKLKTGAGNDDATSAAQKLAAQITADEASNGNYVAKANTGKIVVSESTNYGKAVLADTKEPGKGADVIQDVQFTKSAASTAMNGSITIDKSVLSNGTTVTMGGKTFVLTSDDKTEVTSGQVKVSYGVNASNDEIASALAKAMTDAGFSTVTASGSTVTLSGVTNATSITTGGPGRKLQIGDTSESYNQLAVKVKDMHTNAMGTEGGLTIADVDISTQEGAAAAIQTVKDAINYVSAVRGDLGAIQNRLEHTQNNLSVMAENIQDAESTIRDTDVAEEMMSYVKNNILVQSAQAMLAQANQVPQGVLQLLG